MPRPKPDSVKICHYPGCPGAGRPQPLENFPIVKGESRRQYCKPCYRAHKKDATRQRRCHRRASENVAGAPPLYGRACGGCPELARCQGERLWAKPEPLPCELLLPDEIGVEYESGELTVLAGGGGRGDAAAGICKERLAPLRASLKRERARKELYK